MGKSLPAPTKAQLERFDWIHQIGCVACRLMWAWIVTPPDIHHGLEAGRRVSHDFTYGLCPKHHREQNQVPGIENRHGNPRAFRLAVGTDAQLVAIQNRLIERAREKPRGGA